MYDLWNSYVWAVNQHQTPDSMPDGSPSSAGASFEESDTWPWQCLDCGTTIYQDGDFCQACASSYRLDVRDHGTNSSSGFISWMREQSVHSFVLKTTAVAGIELALTGFWLLTASSQILEMGWTLPIVG